MPHAKKKVNTRAASIKRLERLARRASNVHGGESFPVAGNRRLNETYGKGVGGSKSGSATFKSKAENVQNPAIGYVKGVVAGSTKRKKQAALLKRKRRAKRIRS